MCNDCTSFSTYIKRTPPIVIELGDNNSVTATQYGFVDVIEGYHVEALHTPTFRLSLLSINQLDLDWHTTIFQNGKSSITSPSSYNLTRKLINGIYIIVPANALLSTTKNGKMRKRDSSKVLIAEPTIGPMITDHIMKSTIADPTIECTIADPTIEPTMADPTIEPTIEPTFELSTALIAAKTKSTRQSLTISESRIRHR